MAVVSGKAFRLYVKESEVAEAVVIGKTTTDNFSKSKETQSFSHKDSDGWTEKEHGDKSWQMTSEGFYEETDGGFQKVDDSFDDDTDLYVEFRDTETRTKWEGQAICSNISWTGQDKNKVGLSLTLEGNGILAKSTF